MKTKIYKIAAAMILLSFFALPARAEKEKKHFDTQEVMFPNASRSLALSHFTWGAEFGASLDMTSHNMSTVDADVALGYKNKFFKIIGIGAGIHRSIGPGDNYIPVYWLMRTSFRSRPSLLFMHLSGGYSFNTISDSPMMGDAIANIGCGVNLAMSPKFQSHVLLTVGYQHFKLRHQIALGMDTSNVYLVALSCGVNF